VDRERRVAIRPRRWRDRTHAANAPTRHSRTLTDPSSAPGAYPRGTPGPRKCRLAGGFESRMRLEARKSRRLRRLDFSGVRASGSVLEAAPAEPAPPANDALDSFPPVASLRAPLGAGRQRRLGLCAVLSVWEGAGVAGRAVRPDLRELTAAASRSGALLTALRTGATLR
jgi:hypothetical protein